MKRLLILLFLIFVILVSGCMDQETLVVGPAADGVVIKRFSFDSSTVYEGDTIGLNLEVQNVGEVDATLEEIRVYGGWGEDIKLDLNEKLEASEPEVDFEGEARSTRWKLNVSDVTAETTYSFGTRVVYKYSTIYTGTLRVVTDTYLETLEEGERKSLLESGGVASSSVTGGPLSVKPMKGRNFIVSGMGWTTPVVFKLTNVGSGYPSSSSTINENTMYNVDILSCNGFTKCDSYGSTRLRLSQGKSRLFNCSFSITSPIVNKEDIIFSITFDYYYYVDGTTPITVAPLPGI